MVSNLYSMGMDGICAFVVKIESDVSQGMPMCDIVGLPDVAVKESRNRVRSAIKNSGFKFPVARITVNLAPAAVRKTGSLYDLPIFLAILHASNQIIGDLDSSIFIGELSLSGDICPVSGILSMTLKAKEMGFDNIFVPYENASEAAIITGINVYAVRNVSEVIGHLSGEKVMQSKSPTIISRNPISKLLDFSEIKGQTSVKRALEITAAGGHNILMIGPPGAGKSMLAQRIPTILPEMSFDEMLESTAIHSVCGTLSANHPLVTERPFREPHHNISVAGLCGGGSPPRPGEISLAHNGVLFLDELSEFPRATLDSLRQPLEEGQITVSRVNASNDFPCSIMLVAAMNPCPCGYFGHPDTICTCSKVQIERYLSKISGPILDRIDIHIEVPSVSYEDINSTKVPESSADIRERVNCARELQLKRYKKYSDQKIFSNKQIPSKLMAEICKLTPDASNILQHAFNSLSLSVRSYIKILKVSRTIADLDGNELIDTPHLSEALQYRAVDTKYFFKHT